jgi:hypothetical protein
MTMASTSKTMENYSSIYDNLMKGLLILHIVVNVVGRYESIKSLGGTALKIDQYDCEKKGRLMGYCFHSY